MIKKGITLALAFFLTLGTFAESDPFASVQAKIQNLSQKIAESGVDPGCFNLYGKNMNAYYKTLVNTPRQQDLEKREKDLSVRFNNQSKAWDDVIFKKIVKPFSQSKMACSEENGKYIEQELKTIMDEKNALSEKVLSDPMLYQQYGKEYDPQSKESHIFTETQKTWETLKEKFKAISSAIAEMKISSSSIQNPFSLSAHKQQSISASAASSAQIYYDEFWNSVSDALFVPLYEERSSVLRNLKGLPNNRSKFTTVWMGYGIGSFSKNAQQNIEKKNTDFATEANKIQPVLLNQGVKKNQAIEETVIEYKKQIESNAVIREYPEEFSYPYTKSVTNTLDPAISSISETTKALKPATKALKTRNGNQQR